MENLLNQAPVYLPGHPVSHRRPLDRYLPLHPEGVAVAWLREHIPPGSWVLDPFGASPRLVGEIARAGYRVLSTIHNPISAFLLRMEATAPDAAALNAALAALSSSRVRATRLEPLIRDLYQTTCPACNQTIEARAFLWKKGSSTPYGRQIHCPHCHHRGEFPTSEADRQHAAASEASPLHRARVLERVAPLHDPDRPFVEEALTVYPERALYALTTMINKLDGLNLPPDQHDCLSALLLAACDRGNTLWPHPKERQRPRMLTIPSRYRENNLWLALEEAVDLWAEARPGFPLTTWPELPPESGGACLYAGRLKDIAAELSAVPIAAVVTALPRPNQAYWTLSALWSGWLWGAHAAQDFKSVLRRQRYTWRWHTAALHAIFDTLADTLPAGLPILALMSEAEAGFLNAAALAARLAGFERWAIALRADEQQVQIHLVTPQAQRRPQESETASTSTLNRALQEQAQGYLRQRGEPSLYLPLLAASLRALFQTAPSETHPQQAYADLQVELEGAIAYRGGLLHLRASKTIESGYWWLASAPEEVLPLADRVEMEIVRFLLENPDCSAEAVDTALCAAFPGPLTPETALVHVCLESYAEQSSQGWRVRPQDQPGARRQELGEMATLVARLGQRLGFEVQQVSSKPPVFDWVGRAQRWQVHISASAVLGKYIRPDQPPPGKGLLVLPGGRANLVAYKLRHNPVFEDAVKANWVMVKYRHLRELSEHPLLTVENLEEQLSLDPLTYVEPQLRLL